MAREEGVGRRRRCAVCCERKFQAVGGSHRDRSEGGRAGEEERPRRRRLGPRCGRRRRSRRGPPVGAVFNALRLNTRAERTNEQMSACL
jgi:hypothetical protein